jgi:hypothetical protein
MSFSAAYGKDFSTSEGSDTFLGVGVEGIIAVDTLFSAILRRGKEGKFTSDNILRM